MPTFCIKFSYVGIRWLKRCSLTGPLLTTFFFPKAAKNGGEKEVSLTDNFFGWLVYTINMYSNMKNYENMHNFVRVIQQDKNKTLKNDNC